MFVCFEGIDGVGKTTQATMLMDRIRQDGGKAELVADPGTTALGLAVRQILLHSDEPMTNMAQMLLFSAARAELAAHIKSRMAEGVTVICDRWLLSTLVYQGVLGGIDHALIMDISRKTAQLNPRLCFLLELPVNEAMKRVGKPRDRYERRSPEDWQRMHEAYQDFTDPLPKHSFEVPYRFGTTVVKRIDASLPVEEVHAHVYARYLKVADRASTAN